MWQYFYVLISFCHALGVIFDCGSSRRRLWDIARSVSRSRGVYPTNLTISRQRRCVRGDSQVLNTEGWAWIDFVLELEWWLTSNLILYWFILWYPVLTEINVSLENKIRCLSIILPMQLIPKLSVTPSYLG